MSQWIKRNWEFDALRKRQMPVNNCSLAGVQAREVFQAKQVRHCLLLTCSIFFSEYLKIFFNHIKS